MALLITATIMLITSKYVSYGENEIKNGEGEIEKETEFTTWKATRSIIMMLDEIVNTVIEY